MATTIQQEHGSDLERLRRDGVSELADQFAQVRNQLKKMIAVRLDRRLLARADESDIIQDVFIEAARRLPEYLANPKVKPYMWLRQVGRQTLAVYYRQHVGTAMRTVQRETAMDQLIAAKSESMVGELAESMVSPPSAIARTEVLQKLLELIESMSPEDREVLSLKQLEQLSFDEVALELNISMEAAKKRYQRAVIRLGQLAAHLNDRSQP